MIIDLFETSSFAATASMNLSRCVLSAAGTSAIEPMIKAIGMGWTFTILSGIVVLATPLALAEYRYGAGWRKQRVARLKAEREQLEVEARTEMAEAERKG